MSIVSAVGIKSTHKVIQNYYDALQSLGMLNVRHETGIRQAFQTLNRPDAGLDTHHRVNAQD